MQSIDMSSVSGGDARREGVLLSTFTRIEAVANRNPTCARAKWIRLSRSDVRNTNSRDAVSWRAVSVRWTRAVVRRHDSTQNRPAH